MLKQRYDIFGANAIGAAEFVGKYEFPLTPGIRLRQSPKRVIPFDRMGSLQCGEWLHFYVHDQRFHQFLARKEQYWRKLKAAAGFIGADNSMYRDLPLAEQIHSCYLNRAIDYYLHSRGKPVVANVSWGDWRSYEFCFDGIEPRSTVAVSSYGCCRARLDRSHFEDGFVVMLKKLSPYSVMLHGATWPALDEICNYHGISLLRIPTQREVASLRKEAVHG